MPPVGQPGVAGERVLGHEHRVEAGGLCGAGHVRDGITADELVAPVDPVGREPERRPHDNTF